MEFLLSRNSVSLQCQWVTLIVALILLLGVPGRATLVSSMHLDDPSTAWTNRSPRPMQPLHRVDLDRV